jgi:hypothetical protein
VALGTGQSERLEARGTAELVRKLKEYGDNIARDPGTRFMPKCLLGCLESTDTVTRPSSCNQSIILGEVTGVVDYLTPPNEQNSMPGLQHKCFKSRLYG